MCHKILVTGGAGFIGSHLCKRLLEEGNKVICYDNLFTGHKRNIESLLEDNRFEFVRGDVTSKLDFDVDKIYNLACPASPVHYQKDPVKTIKTSVLGAINVLELACDKKCRILQASTSEVYGDPEVHPQVENYWGNVNPVGIRSCYDEGKRCAETLIMDYHRNFNIDTKIIRIFNTYGPNMDKNDGRVVSNFIMQALSNTDITIYGDGSQTRSFQYVDDLVEGMVRVMDNQDGFHSPVNIGNPVEYTIKQLAEKIIQLCNSKSKIVYMSLPSDDPKQRKPDISLAKEKFNWTPKINIDEGLMKTIEYFKKVKNINLI